ncbi:hypothetical protein G5I_09550 [Acromyrmex echinatior]|uniref:Uncharacterized protein n=1 Tax=Acromyrmex echinatior TaxID=103372 RepID=F4WUH9_ACREC|nr:hypothetical protein G5I_09550 [Acromyrmex echinatior]
MKLVISLRPVTYVAFCVFYVDRVFRRAELFVNARSSALAFVNKPRYVPNELPYQTGEESSAEIVAKKNSKSHSLCRVMELKDLEFGTREWIGFVAVTVSQSKKYLNPWIMESCTYHS